MKSITHLADLKDDYSVFVFPIYGILHDRKNVNKEAYHILEELHELGKTVVIFTNVPHRRQRVISELVSMGISPPLYQHVITAGEETWQHLKDQHDPFHAALGERCYLISSTEDLDILEGLPCHRASSLEQADYILVMGTDEWHPSLQDYQETLEQALALHLPMVCGDPDRYVRYNGERMVRAGAIAEQYEKMGAPVYFHGKPFRKFYATLLKEVAPIEKNRILMIGDSLKTDVKGAINNGLDSLLFLDLTSYDELSESQITESNQRISREQIFAQINKMGYSPTYITHELKW
jgi:HAD superfamily hydrolase (TIGR01459 family)